MLFRRRSQEGPDPPAGGSAGREPAASEAALHNELGIHHLWYLELRLREELARAARTEGIFSLATWRMRLLPGETIDPALRRRSAELIREGLRTYDIIAALDDERFAGLLLDADHENASTVAFRIKGDLQTRVASAGKWQAGVATYGRDGTEGPALINTAFRRLDEDARAA